jgi:O-antigen/teichoic acid export membrane protein
MKQSFRSNISANIIQLLINQAFGLLVFYFLSKGLSKADFGELNWALAIFLAVFIILSFGIDQVIIRKIAAGENKKSLLSIHFFHVLSSGILFYGLLAALHFIFPNVFGKHSLLLLLGIGKLVQFFSTPFKSIASGSEHFKAVLYMSISSAVIKGLCIVYLFYTNDMSLPIIIPVFIIADVSEFIFGFYLTRKVLKVPFVLNFYWKEYKQLVKEAFPQIGVVVFSSALARIDWILIGLFLGASKLAEYSFAYKAFELSSLPLLAIAPLLVPYFTRLLREGKKPGEQQNIHLLLRGEMMIACFAALCINIVWNPFADVITDGKYGAANTTTILILSASLPVLYLNNFLWSVHFAYGNLKLIVYSFAFCFSINLLGNLILIPIIGNEGAALSYLLSISAQTLFYASQVKEKMRIGWQPLVFCSACAVCSGAISKYSSLNVWWLLPLCILSYFILLFCTVQLHKTDWTIFRRVMNL